MSLFKRDRREEGKAQRKGKEVGLARSVSNPS